ncbi:sterol carrier family protein [Zhihengliuella flava]|uniref:Bacterial SCP orthologue domain-containing protein n=1 Tax=Zhihengliuella flava TaxID=1285193 RepID=A0A931D878_9MICC|nr:hypothetical protein [Zhihengliuella flava]
MGVRRRISAQAGRAALDAWRQGGTVDRATLATAVRFALEELSAVAEGDSVEVRVPPFGVAQCLEGPRHTRGTPPNVVEMTADVWLSLATGGLTWPEAKESGRLTASGIRADLSAVLPLF